VCPAILAIAVFHTVVSFAQPSATLTSAAVLRSPTARDAMVERQPPVVLKGRVIDGVTKSGIPDLLVVVFRAADPDLNRLPPGRTDGNGVFEIQIPGDPFWQNVDIGLEDEKGTYGPKIAAKSVSRTRSIELLLYPTVTHKRAALESVIDELEEARRYGLNPRAIEATVDALMQSQPTSDVLATRLAQLRDELEPGRAVGVYGSLSGSIVDEAGASLPGVTVTITNLERNTVHTVVTNESGRYVKERLPPGTYTVTAELPGFTTRVMPDVAVTVGTQTALNVPLDIGKVTQTVNVAAETPLLSTDRADLATTFHSKQLTDLPVLDRDFTRLILLTPGTQQLTWQRASETPQASVQAMINGHPFSGMKYQVDGVDNSDAILGAIIVTPTLESIDETLISTQNYGAEFGQGAAGVVAVQTRSGTNQFRGSAFEFFQSDKFQARNPFTQFAPDSQTGRILPRTRRNQFGGSIGGPVVRNHWHFFGDYEGTRSIIGGSRLVTVPTEAARRGDFSAYGVQIFDPLTGPPETRVPFQDNRIPATRLSPQALAILQLIPLPNVRGRENDTINNYVASGSETFNADAFNVRVDTRFLDRVHTFARYSLGDYMRDGSQAFGAGGGKQHVNLGGVAQADNQSLASGIDYTISPSALAEFRFGWFRYAIDVLPSDFGTTPANDAGIPGLNFDNVLASGLPAIFIGSDSDSRSMAFGTAWSDRAGRCNCPVNQDEHQYQLTGSLTKLTARHTLRFGIEARHAANRRLASEFHRSGELFFENDRTRGPSGGGLSLASFLLGDVTRFIRYVSPATDAAERQWRYSLYAQDVWRPTERWTLNYGVRLDVTNPQTVNEPGNGGFLDLRTGLINVAGVGDVKLDGGIDRILNWAPRFGLTYQINDRTVLRAGYGRSHYVSGLAWSFGNSATQNLPVLLAQELNPPQNFERVFNMGEGPPSPEFPVVPASGRFSLPNGVFSRALPSEVRTPHVNAFTLTVQRQLTHAIAVEAGYVGNRGRNVFAGDTSPTNVNQPTLSGFPNVPTNFRRPFFAGNVPNRSGFGGPFGWTQSIAYFCNCATNAYDSVQARLTKRFSDGYSVQASYTLQRAIQDSADYFFFDSKLNRGPASWDRTHNFVMSLMAELPFGLGRRVMSDVSPWLELLVGGWQINSNAIVQSGIPFEVTYRDAGQDRDVGPNRPNLIRDPTGPKTRDEWFNAASIGAPGSAFSRPARGTFGNFGRNQLRGPGYWRVDASVFKNIRLGGSRLLQLRAEATNVFNNVNLGNPDSEIGLLGNENPNAGRITSTAYGGEDPQRIWQFGIKFSF
jgi:outer membrane receptor protein involved in Fe transport